MRAALKGLLGGAIAIVVGALLVWAFVEGRAELARERERERPVKQPARVAQNAAGDRVVWLDAETQTRVGLTMEPLAAVTRIPEAVAYGTVLDPAPLIDLQAELSSAEAARTASHAEYDRLTALARHGDNVAAKAVEAAAATFHADDQRVLLAARRLASDWGQVLSALTPNERDTLVQRLAARESVLIRADLLPGERLSDRPRAARVTTVDDTAHPLAADAVFAAPSIGRLTQGQGWVLRIDAAPDTLRPGAAVTAFLERAARPETGVVIPRHALVRVAGTTWAYVQVGPEEFTRREVVLTAPLQDGWFVTSGFRPGDRLVVTGAQTLLSEELKSQIQVLEE